MSNEYVIEMRNISKRFLGVRALEDVDFKVKRGEVRALVGKNGAGKSTLIKILTGLYQPTSGQIYINGSRISNVAPDKMYGMGIEAIYQENDLVPFFSVAASIMLNYEPVLGRVFLNQQKMHETAGAILTSKLGVAIDTHKLIKELDVSEKQFVQISRSLVKNPKVMIFDEPTAPLLEEEIKKLFTIIEKLKSEGVTIIYISHRLEEIFAIADTVTVLKDGRKEADLILSDTTEDELIRTMTGKSGGILAQTAGKAKKKDLGAPVFTVNKLTTPKLKEISFELHEHEVLGFFGVEGAGQEELTKALFALIPAKYEAMTLHGKGIKVRNPYDAIRKGIGYIPRDRKEEGLIEGFSVRENVTLPSINQFTEFSFIKPQREKVVSQEMVEELSIVTPGIDALVRYLSGGNQQKVAIAKWLALDLHLLILDYPTMGIDVQAKSEVYRILADLAAGGTAIILITPEYEEVKTLCDNVIVLRDGEMVTSLPTENLDEQTLFTYAIGNTGTVKGGRDNG